MPVLDEAAALPGLLQDIAAQPGLPARMIFVDNGSRDGSDRILVAAGFRVLHEHRRGYDFACMTGLLGAVADGADVVAFMEADGSDDPADLPRLLGPVLAGDVDLLIGSRQAAVRTHGRMAWHQRVGNRFALALFRLLFGLHLPDNGPFRAVRTDRLGELDLEPRAFAWTTEMVLKAHLAGWRIAWVDTAYRERSGHSKISGTVRGTWGAFVGIVGTTLRLRLTPRPFARRPIARRAATSIHRQTRTGVPPGQVGVHPQGAAGLTHRPRQPARPASAGRYPATRRDCRARPGAG